jgi:hypothetical protein
MGKLTVSELVNDRFPARPGREELSSDPFDPFNKTLKLLIYSKTLY